MDATPRMPVEPSSPQWPPYEAWRQRRILAPIAWVMGKFQVPELARADGYGKQMYWFAFPRTTLAQRQTLEANITTDRDFWATVMFATATQASINGGGSFRAQIMDVGILKDRSDRHKFHDKTANQLTAFCTAQAPYLWRVPHFIPAGHPVNLRMVNLATAQNIVQVSIFGYSEDFSLRGYQVRGAY